MGKFQKVQKAMENGKKKAMVAAATVTTALIAGPAHAAVDLTTYTLDATPVETLVGIILGGLGLMWGARKLIKTINRS